GKENTGEKVEGKNRGAKTEASVGGAAAKEEENNVTSTGANTGDVATVNSSAPVTGADIESGGASEEIEEGSACLAEGGLYGTVDRVPFGLESFEETTSARIKFEWNDDPVISLARDFNDQTLACQADAFQETQFEPKQDWINTESYCDKGQGYIPVRSVYVSKANADRPYIARVHHTIGDPQGIVFKYVFVTRNEGGSYEDWMKEIQSTRGGGKILTDVVESINKAAKDLRLIEQDNQQFINITAASTKVVYLEDSSSQMSIENLCHLTQSCNEKSIVIGYFPDFVDEQIQSMHEGYKAAFTILQMNPDQEKKPGMITDADIIINLSLFSEDSKIRNQQLSVALARQILFALGLEGTWDDENTLLSNRKFLESIPADIPWQFEANSKIGQALFYAYGKYQFDQDTGEINHSRLKEETRSKILRDQSDD
ncbi:MAG: hypothetical protein KDD48_04030, partial [Bdellovibrionales bacterium]|nr:hypothetical protein [Bdellovibrionales bacterium]